jgi:DNA-binding NarL/FixJ family response regulator
MRSSPTRKKRPLPPAEAPPHADVQGLVERLIKQLADEKPAAPPAPPAADNEVMLDVQMDGVRCVLMRVPKQPVRPAVVLSPREREIARMVSCGYPNKTIAGVLEISSWTVSTYLRRIFAKLNVNSRAAMVTRLMEEGLLKS